jgi:hypothetical protein
VKLPKAKSKVQRKKEHPTLFVAQNNPSNPTANILSIFIFIFMEKKIDGLLTIVWISIHVQPKLPSRVYCLGQGGLPCRHFGEQRPLDFDLLCEGSRGRTLGFLQADW